jgi:hypothetical protein
MAFSVPSSAGPFSYGHGQRLPHGPSPSADTHPERARSVVYGLFMEDLSARQVGDLFGIPESQVSQILRLACDRLLTELGRPPVGLPVDATGEVVTERERS